tara:strand:- start:2 stop:379 length:378 start_codon:yes stop_codon:yes gene_type:complete
MSDCIFCSIEQARILKENKDFFVIRDQFPVTDLHTLIISKRHVNSYFELSNKELISFNELLFSQQEELISLDSDISGFNIGINDGVDAGQTIMHFHAHLIPRRTGDVQNPRGGVRGIIPEKQNYE